MKMNYVRTLTMAYMFSKNFGIGYTTLTIKRANLVSNGAVKNLVNRSAIKVNKRTVHFIICS